MKKSFSDVYSGNSFQVDPNNGNLTVKDALDFESKAQYTLEITANDSINIAKFNLTINIKTGKNS